jgi:hypothetical protein
MGRTGILNFLLLAIALLVYNDHLEGIAIVSFVLALVSVPVWVMQGKRYYRRVGIAYQELSVAELEPTEQCLAPLPPTPLPPAEQAVKKR